MKIVDLSSLRAALLLVGLCLVSSANHLSANVLFIGDFVYYDLNCNGIQDEGEPGASGVQVELYSCDTGQLYYDSGIGLSDNPTTTDADGYYYFFPADGEHQFYIKFILPPDYVFTPQNQGGDNALDSDAHPATGETACFYLPLVDGIPNSDDTWDAGLCEPAHLGDFVWNDTNANGMQDEGEEGVDEIVVELYTCPGDMLVATTVTSSGGLYGFIVPPGDYYVKFTGLPIGFVFSPSTPSMASDPMDSDANPATGKTDCTNLTAGDTDATWDAGIYQPATIGDFVWNDTNANGVQDGGELGVDGVTVELYTCVGDMLVATTATSGGGLYSFTVPPGDYYVKFSLPPGFVFSPSTPSGASDPDDSDADPATGQTDCTTLDPGETDPAWDAGIYQPATIGDFVWNDTNADGVQDGGELGVDGVTVELYTCVGDMLVATTVTSGGGFYSFTVPPGDYYVQFSNLPPGFVFSPSTPSGASDPADSDADPTSGRTDCTTLVSGENDPSWDAGIYAAAPCLELTKVANTDIARHETEVTYTYTVHNCGATLLENVQVVDDNGTPDYAEDDFVVCIIPSLAAGATVECEATTIPPVQLCASTTGQQTGLILISEILGDGNIKVTFIQDRGVNDNTYGANIVGWNRTHKFSDLVGSDQGTFQFKNGAGQIVLEFKLDYISATSKALYPAGYGTLGVTGGDGRMLKGSAAHILAYSTSLTENLNQSPFLENLAQYTVNSPHPTTDPNWALWEDRMIYTVVVDKAAFGASGFGLVTITAQHNSPQKIGNFTPLICDGCVTNTAYAGTVLNDEMQVMDVAQAEVCLTANPAVIGDRVWFDGNGNGVQDGGEPGAAGLEVRLLNCDGNVLKTTTTDANGFYTFTVLAGSYQIQFTAAAGYTFSPNGQGGNTALDSDANSDGKTGCFAVAAGQTDLTRDAGLYQPIIKLTKMGIPNTIALGEPVLYYYKVENVSGQTVQNIVIVDDNGTPDYPGDDFIVGEAAELAPMECEEFLWELVPPLKLCTTISGNTLDVGSLIIEEVGGDIKVTFLQSRSINDNVYGTSAVPPVWPRAHKFKELTGSDKAQFRFTDGSGKNVLEFYVDYISAASGTPSGYRSLGVSGGEGKMVVGSAANVLSATTTLDYNLNIAGFPTYIVNSPAPESSFPAWQYVNGYEVVVKASAFGPAGFGGVRIVSVHNSPSKIGVNAISPQPCSSCLVNTAVATGWVGGQPTGASATAEVCIEP